MFVGVDVCHTSRSRLNKMLRRAREFAAAPIARCVCARRYEEARIDGALFILMRASYAEVNVYIGHIYIYIWSRVSHRHE